MSRFENKRLFVVHYSEVILLIVLFLLVLVLLYPHDFIRRQVLAENSNYDLTVAYLQNMLKRDPKNELLLLALAKAARKEGNIDLGLKLIEVLQNSPNKHMRLEALKLRYILIKRKLQTLQENNKTHSYEVLKELLYQIAKQSLDKDEALDWYREAQSMQDNASAYLIAKTYVGLYPNDTEWLKRAYYYARKTKRYASAFVWLDRLIQYTSFDKQWLQEGYQMSIDTKNKQKGLYYIDLLAKSDIEKMKMKSSFFSILGLNEEASQVNLNLFAKTRNVLWFKKAITLLLEKSRLENAYYILKYNEAEFYNNEAMMQWYIELYLSLNHPQDAASLSKRLLEAVNK